MTEALYLIDSTVPRFEATIERVISDRPYRIVLDRTHFYPTGGGQPSDHGHFIVENERIPVEKVEKRDTIYHHVPDASVFKSGRTITGEIDWNRRYSHMRYHTAQHVLSAVLLDEFEARTVGNQLYHDRARLDCEHQLFAETDLDDIESLVNQIIQNSHPVSWYTVDRDDISANLDPKRTRIDLLPDSITEIRIVEIDGIDRTACAGTHVSNTNKIGQFSIEKRETGGAGRERLHFILK